MQNRFIKYTLSVGLFFCLGTIGIAQPLDSLRAVKRIATETFLDPTQSRRARLAARTQLGYPEAETFDQLLNLVLDTSDDDVIRLEAAKRLRYDEDYLDAVLSIIADPAEDGELVAGLISDLSRRTTFRVPTEIRQRIQSALRDRLDDNRPAVRLAAYQALVPSHDNVAIDRLVESLRQGNNVPIPLAAAIELLDVDGPTKHIGTIRPYLNHEDPEVRAQAARILSVDPESQSDIVQIATNKNSPRAVRLHALRALSREDEQFMEYAITLLLDQEESPDVRYEVMRVAMGHMNYKSVPASVQIRFARAVEAVSGQSGIITEDQKDVGAEAKELLAHLRRHFPAIRKFYDDN